MVFSSDPPSFVGDVVMDAPPAHHAVCAPASERYVSCFMLFPFFLRRSVSGSCSHTPVRRCQFLFTVKSSSFIHSVLSFFNAIKFCSFNFFQFSPGLQARRTRFDHSLSLPTENWTCFIEASPHLHCTSSVVHVHLDHRSSLSRIFRIQQ